MNTAAKLTFVILKFNVTFINKSPGDTKKDALFKTRPKPKVNVQLRWIGRFSKSSWIEFTANGLPQELGVNGAKKVNGNWDIIDKNGHSTFHSGKHESKCQKKLLWLLTSLR